MAPSTLKRRQRPVGDEVQPATGKEMRVRVSDELLRHHEVGRLALVKRRVRQHDVEPFVVGSRPHIAGANLHVAQPGRGDTACGATNRFGVGIEHEHASGLGKGAGGDTERTGAAAQVEYRLVGADVHHIGQNLRRLVEMLPRKDAGS